MPCELGVRQGSLDLAPPNIHRPKHTKRIQSSTGDRSTADSLRPKAAGELSSRAAYCGTLRPTYRVPSQVIGGPADNVEWGSHLLRSYQVKYEARSK